MASKMDMETAMELHDLQSMFPTYGPGRRIAALFADGFAARPAADRSSLLTEAKAAAGYLHQEFRDNAFLRDGDLSAWFAAEALPLSEISRLGRVATQAYREAEAERIAAMGEDEFYALEEREEIERDRINRLEDDGYYGRTHAYTPECDQWIYLRFGALPTGGRSRCGLIGEDTEDGPDEWRTELAGMTHEAGICVLRAYRHPDVEGAYVIILPDFSMALYGVSGSDSYLNAIIPSPQDDAPFILHRLDGSLVTNKARDGTARIELGSDGEYMLDPRRHITEHLLTIEQVYVHETVDLRSFLLDRRGIDYDRRPARSPTP